MKNHNAKLKTLKFAIPAFFLMMIVLAPVFFASAASLVPCGGSGEKACELGDFFVLINNIINFLLFSIATPLAALSFAVAGWMYLTAGGDTGKIKSAHDIFKNVAIGFIIVLSAWLIVKVILLGLGIQPGFSKLENVGQ
ncbi:MAG: hypothetical protein HYT28_00575 [Parcubacteria group bacterium]|nr:hypothetical protein [Parcubacteria group bacterium]